ncbi:tyrosine-type recombinase/integrase [Micromonospora sp. NPDC007220]|uniref:tyrosine-type recombinase/integrase n=1 Tax=Micromonospora sp. NPDC007220 TaxID=3154318 RepID=UPI0033CE3533
MKYGSGVASHRPLLFIDPFSRDLLTADLHIMVQYGIEEASGGGGDLDAEDAPHMLRHTFVTTTLDAGVSLRDVQIAARHTDPRTTMRYDRARKDLDRHPNYILAAYMASGA